MKQIFISSIILSSVLFYFSSVKAQTLEFSRVLLVTTQDQVPTGYVWKVTGVAGTIQMLQSMSRSTATPSTLTSSFNLYARPQIIINSDVVDVGQAAVGAGGGSGTGSGTVYSLGNTIYTNIPTTFPLWLPQGTTLEVGDKVNYISVIEFRVQ